MTDSAADFIAVVLGIGVFLVIVAVGWRSVQRRRILRMQGANGQETIILAREGDEVSNIVTTTETMPAAPAPTPAVGPETAPEFGHKSSTDETLV